MKNNFQSNGKGRNQRVWQLLISMLIILTMGIGQMWGADPQDTYYKFTAAKSSGQTIAPVSGDGGNITMGSNSAATVTSNTGSYCGVSYTYAANINSSDAKGFSLNINASATNPAHVFLALSASSARTIYLKNGSSNVDQCYGRGAAASPALVELVTTKSGSHIVYASGSVAVYAVRVIYENNDTWQELKGLTSITLNKDKTLADDFTTFLFFRLQDLTFNGDGVLVSNTQDKLRYTINFKALADGEVTLNCANPGSSDRTLSVKELTRPETLSGTAVYSTTVAKKSPAEYADHKFNVEKGKEYVIGFSGSGATIKSVNFTATGEKHSVTYALGGDYGTTPTQADVAEGAKFTLHNGTTGITAPSGKQFAGWNDGSSTYAGGAEYTMGTSDVTLTAVWENAKTDPTATFSAGAYVIGESALDLSTLWSSNSDGAVTYALKVASEDATVSGTSFSATKAGSYVVTASQAATATYNAVEKEATITVTVNPLGTHTLTWTMKVGKKNYSTLLDEASSTSTYLTAGSSLNLGTATTIDAGQQGASDRTIKVFGAGESATERNDNSYVEFPFTIASGYMFTPTAVSVKVANVSTAKSYDLVLLNADGTSTKERTTFTSTKTDGSVETITWSEITGLSLTGSGKLRVYAFNKGTTDGFRFGTPIAITGTVVAAGACEPPTNPSVTSTNWIYVPGETINLTASATGTTASTTYTWYKGADLATAKAAGAIQAAKTSAQGGTTYSCTASDAYRYWCVISNGTCEASASYDIKIYKFCLYDNSGSDVSNAAFATIDRTNSKISVDVALANAAYTYKFKVTDGFGTWYGKNESTITSSTNWLDGLVADEANVGLTSTGAGSYTIDYYYNVNNVVVTYPTAYTITHSAATNGTYTIKVGDASAVSTDATAYYGQTITLAASPADDYIFSAWTVMNGETPVEVTNNSFTMPAGNVTVSASFTAIPTVADLVEISEDWTFTPSAALTTNTLYEEGKIISLGGSNYNNGIQIKTNRQIAFKVSANAKIKVTFNTKDTRELQIGTTSAGTDLAHSPESPISAVRAEAGIVYLSASSDLYMTKLEIFYPKTVTYVLGDGSGTPTESAHYEGDKFTVHNGVTGITAPSGQEFDKWKDQDNADVAGGAEYTMPAKAVTLTAQWRAETVKYTVTYDLDDYTAGVAPTETNKAAGDVFAIKAAPSRDGYAFMGWLCDIDAQTYQATDDYTMTAAATTFTAVWKQEFQVTFNLNGHGDPIAAQVKLDGAKVTKPADPFEFLYEFGGWYKEAACTNAWDFENEVVTKDTVLYAKWTEFDGCAYLAPAASGDALHIGDNVALNTASFGGTLKVANMKTEESTIQYNGYGLYFSGGGKDSLRVTINNQMQVGSKITVALRAGTNGTSGLKLMTLGGTEKAALGWTSATNGDEGTFSYTVTAGDGLEGTKAFRLQRNGSVYLKYVSVENCAPQDFTVTYKDGESTTLGTEDVIENEHPTATGIATKKQGYVFQGWAETNGGSVVDLNDIVITADKTLYAVYTVRVCATSGSMFKFQMKTDLTNGNVFASAPNSVAATTTNYLAELAGGEVTFSVTGGNNRLQFNDQKAISFANSAGGQITINLDCPLAEGDEVRFINYASNGNSANLSDGTNSQILNGNNSETVQTWSVPATWAGKYELTLTRGGNTAKITYFEIYRRPAVTGVSVADLTVREGASVTPVMTLAPSDDALVTKQAWSILSGDDKITINQATGVVTGVHEGDAVIKVVLNDDPTISATATVHVVETFVQQDVTESIVWDFSKAGTASTFADQVLANVDGVTLDVTQFDARKLVGTANNITSTYFQGTMLTFNATTAGKLSVRFTNGNSNVRTLKVYAGNPEVEIASWSYSNAATENKSIDVPAGKVTLRSYQGDAPNNVRIMNLEFLALAHQRTTGYNAGDLGTVCLEDATIIEGANLYELAGLNENGYLAFDEVLSGELEEGKPYLFEVTNPSKISFYKPVGAAHSDSEIGNKGMIGTFNGTTLYQGADNLYYFSGRHIWKVNDFTVAIPIPDHRCYVDYDAVQAAGPAHAPVAGRRRVTLGVQGTQVTTDINNVGSDDVQCTKVMIDGQLYILRGEKMYDATGRLVK